MSPQAGTQNTDAPFGHGAAAEGSSAEAAWQRDAVADPGSVTCASWRLSWILAISAASARACASATSSLRTATLGARMPRGPNNKEPS